MSQGPIVSLGDFVAVILPATVLDAAGMRVGDVVEVTAADRQLILRPVDAAGHRQRLEQITREVFEQRRDAYQRLA